MDNVAVIYKSRYGTTKKYAGWISEGLGAKLLKAEDVKPEQLLSYDIVVYGGGLYAGGIDGVGLVTKNRCKSLVVFTVGFTNPDTTDYSEILKKNFKQDILERTKVFHLRGGIDYQQLGLMHGTMMALRKKMIEKKAESKLTDEDRLIIESYGRTIDFADKATIEPLVDYVRGQQQK